MSIDQTDQSSLRATRKLVIRDAMLNRSIERRRTRQRTRAAISIGCMGLVFMLGWLVTAPNNPASKTGESEGLATSIQMTEDQVNQTHTGEFAQRVTERAISDDELVELLAEAGEQAGLAIIDGQAQLVRWDSEPVKTDPDQSDPTGLLDETHLLSHQLAAS